MNILPSISNFFIDELASLLPEVFFNDIRDDLLKLSLKDVAAKDTKYSLILEAKNFEEKNNEFGIKLSTNEEYGKIFRLSAQNQRYKTTSILIISILLGYNVTNAESSSNFISSYSINDKKEILNNDRLIQRFDNIRNCIFSNAQEESINKYVKFQIMNVDEIILGVEITNDQIVLSINGDPHVFSPNNEYCYEDYLQKINEAQLFNPHLISKGRNFVKYILVEETKNYWRSLEKILEVIKSKNSRWMELSSKYSIEILNQRINAIDLLNKISKMYPNYFKYRNLYFDYTEIKEKELPSEISDDQLILLNELLETKRIQLELVLLSIERILYDIRNLLDVNLIGSYKQIFDEYTDIFTGNNSKELDFIVNKSFDSYPVRGFSILLTESTGKRQYDVKDSQTLEIALKRISCLQSKYCEAQVIFFENKSQMQKQLGEVEDLNKEIKQLEDSIQIMREQLTIKSKLQDLEQILQPVFEEMEKLTDKQLELIEQKMKEAGISNLNDLPAKLKELESHLKKEVFDITPLSDFLENLNNAYHIFGKEISLMSRGIVSNNLVNIVQRNPLLQRLIDIFQNDIVNRCRYYYKTTDKVNAFSIKRYDFWERAFYSEDNDILDLQSGLSGGTDSVMTVYSLATSSSANKYGNVLFIDEWGDVSESFHAMTRNKLLEVENFSFAIFVDVNDLHNTINISVEGG